jgi:hypothetical protein
MTTQQRPLKEGSVRTYQEKVGLGFVDILANEMDADLDTIYAAWNGGVDSVTLKDLAVTTPKIVDGAVTYAKLAANAQLWRDTGTALTPGPSFTARQVTLTSGAPQLVLGTARTTGVLSAPAGSFAMICNDAAAPGDTTKSSWQVVVNADGDAVQFWRRAPGAAAGWSSTPPFQLQTTGNLFLGSTATSVLLGLSSRITLVGDNNSCDIDANGTYSPTYDRNGSPTWRLRLMSWNGDAVQLLRRPVASDVFTVMHQVDASGNLVILGPTATKASGTTWANPSDRRLKDEITDYATGLAAITQLQPRTFVYNGKGGSTAGMRGYGFVADEVQPIMPETVGVRAGKLDAADEAETDIQTLDQSNLILALVNATKELAARVAALEGAAA